MNNKIEEFIDEKTREFKEGLIRIVEEENKPKTVWDLERGDEYYYINSKYDILPCTFDNRPFDLKLRENGNMFLTQEEAEFELERRKIEVIMRKYSIPFHGKKDNWSIYYDHFDKAVEITYWNNHDHGFYCFETRKVAQQVINEIGKERLNKYWFRVEE